MKFTRIVLQQTATDDPSQMVLDVVLGKDRKPAHNLPIAGWWGIPKGNHWLRPIVFRPDGLVDFGGDPETPDSERFSKMTLHDRIFDIGEKFFSEDFDDGEVYVFFVKRLIDLENLNDLIWDDTED